jgi:hypothetical protein
MHAQYRQQFWTVTVPAGARSPFHILVVWHTGILQALPAGRAAARRPSSPSASELHLRVSDSFLPPGPGPPSHLQRQSPLRTAAPVAVTSHGRSTIIMMIMPGPRPRPAAGRPGGSVALFLLPTQTSPVSGCPSCTHSASMLEHIGGIGGADYRY